MMNARMAAAGALKRMRTGGVWPEKWLRDACRGMEKREEALAYTLSYSVIRNYRLIDWYISKASALPLKKISPEVLDILRLGVAQLAFFDKIPQSAAVSESVEMVKKGSNPKAAGFCNAVLRRLTILPEPPRDAAVKYSHPDWFCETMLEVLGREKCEKMLAANNEPVLYNARVNTLRTDDNELISSLSEKGYSARLLDYPPHAIELDSINGIFDTEEHKNGLFHIQDGAAQAAVYALDPKPGELMIDLCAAPGGKSLLACQLMENSGRVIAVDPAEQKLDLIRDNARRTGAGIIEPMRADGTKMPRELFGTADRVLCDVPCSGTGVIRKKPEIRLKDQREVLSLMPIQSALLDEGFRLLKCGGTLVYSTCSVLPCENEGIVNAFLSRAANARLLGDMKTSYPGVDPSDGFFIAKIGKM